MAARRPTPTTWLLSLLLLLPLTSCSINPASRIASSVEDPSVNPHRTPDAPGPSVDPSGSLPTPQGGSSTPAPVPPSTAVQGDNPGARDAWFRAGRQSTSTTPAAALRRNAISTKIRAEARLRTNGMYSALSGNTLSPPPWQELGPRPQSSPQYGNVAGRVTSIAVDLGKDPTGNTVYVGTAYGGLWESTNGLSANPVFTPLTENAATLAIGAIAIDSSTSPSTIYVGTGEPDSSIDSYYGIGVMKSIDGGQSWSVISTANAGARSFYGLSFSKLLVDENLPQIVIGCTRLPGTPTFRNLLPGIYRSTDSGETWTLMFTTPFGCSDLVYQRSTHTYFAALRGAGLLASTSSGAAWVNVGNPIVSGTTPSIDNLTRIALATRNNELWVLMVDSKGNLSTPVPCPAPVGPCDTGLSLSNDGGHTWTAMLAPTTAFGPSNQGWYDVYFAAPGNAGTLALGGIDMWSGTWNGSNSITWTNMTQSYNGGSVHADQHAFYGLDDSRWYIGNDGGIWATTNAGSSWINGNASIGAIQFTSTSNDTQIAGQYFGGSQDNGTAVGTPGNSTWSTIYPGDGGYTLSSRQVASRYLTENYYVSLERSDNRGNSFQTVVDSTTVNENSSFYVPYVFADSSEANLLLGTCHIWRGPVTAVNGTGWSPISPDLSNTSSCGSYITALTVAPGSPDFVYAVTRNGNVWQSVNATQPSPAWSVISSQTIPQRPLSAVAVDPTNPTNVYVAAQGFDTGHIFRRINGTWSDISGNLPNIPVNSIAVDPLHPLNIYVATDAGVYMTSDGGTPQSGWELIGTGLPNVAVLELKIVPGASRLLLAATHGRGAWTVPMDGVSANLGAPSLQSPINGANAPLTNTQFSWLAVSGANGYRILVTPNPASLPGDPASASCLGCIISDISVTASYTSTATLTPNSTYTWQVQAYNTSTGQNGPWSATATFTTGPAPDGLSFSPSILKFGNIGVFTSAFQTLQVTNNGISSAILSSVALQDARQFSLTNNCPVTLLPSSSCLLTVTFSPQSAGPQQTQLTLTNAQTGTTHSLLMTGVAQYSLVSLDSPLYDFGHQKLNTDSQTRVLTVSNPSNMVLVLGMFFSGDFRGSSNCGTELAPGASCTTSITFHPTAKGVRTGSVTVFDNTVQGMHTVQLIGSGDPDCGKQSGGGNIGCIDPTPTP